MDHIQRETYVYQMIRRAFQKDKRGYGNRIDKAFVDIGSNHGIMALFAAKNGATSIIAVEPNQKLARLIIKAFARNAMPTAEIFNAACIDAQLNETVRLKDHGIAEGAIGTVVRSTTKGAGHIPAAPVAAFLPPNGGTVGVLKIDVEGHELSVMASLVNALQLKAWNIENVVIEFGPPSRWQASSTSYTPAMAVTVLSSLRAQGYEVHVMDSFAYKHFKKRASSSVLGRKSGVNNNPEGMRHKKYGIRVDPLNNGDWSIMDAMADCNCEAYLWLYKPTRGDAMYNKENQKSLISSTRSSVRYIHYWFTGDQGLWSYWKWCVAVVCAWGCYTTFCTSTAGVMRRVQYESVHRSGVSGEGGEGSKRYIGQEWLKV